ncbi:hypothetical protein NCS57_00538300 [Fusarium keratoplasticum]|uniref:Uncharacterized protein n=1 Tax=Fusarium keratoplasticum TaxID=1328300 RepID=A0ACC0R0A6_9HYPO|nr:hypothetical protein NCS57_00538300 [Fusarium keratoplasticum]KAI8670659.1 hypothetical protein NCS57_00538300 [Fusarium keratoplasticum]
MNVEQQHTKALQAQFENDNANEKRLEEITDQIKHSIIHQYNWEELLHPMPVLIQSIAACFAAARCDMTHGYGPNQPVGNKEQLASNLDRCGELGDRAMMLFHENMPGVRHGTMNFDFMAEDVVRFMEDPELAGRMLKSRVDELKKYIDGAYSNIKEIDEALERWLNHTMAFHAGCLQMQSRMKNEEWDTAMDQLRFSPQANTSDAQRNATEKFGKQVGSAFAAFKNAAEICPPGNDILGQQVVRELADFVSTSFGQLLESYSQNLLPDRRGAPTEYVRKRQLLYTDPAYAEVKRNIVYFELINAVVNGGDMRSPESLSFAKQMLSEAKNSFQYPATREEPSQQLLSALDNAINIANLLGPGGVYTGINVYSLQLSYKATYLSVQKLAAIGRALPGSGVGGGPVMGTSQDLRSIISRTDAKSVQAQAVLESAKCRLATKQKYLFQSHELYSETHDKIGEQLSRITEVIAELGELAQNNKMSLEEIKTILIRSAELIAHIKGQVMALCRFFKAAVAAIHAMTTYMVNPFLEMADTRSGEGKRLGNYSLGDLKRTVASQAAITLRAYVSVFNDFSRQWSDICHDPIMNRLGKTQQHRSKFPFNEIASEIDQLQGWSKMTRGRMATMSYQWRKDVLEKIGERDDKAKLDNRDLALKPETLQAVDAGMRELEGVAKDVITMRFYNSPLNQFGLN